MREWWAKLRALLSGRRELADELREEVEAHLEHEMQEDVARGMSPKEAHEASRRRFGNPTLIRENAMDSWTFRAFENMVRDFAYAGRTIRKNRAFTVTAVLTLALGIGGTTAVFSLVQGILLKPLPERLGHAPVRVRPRGGGRPRTADGLDERPELRHT
jgi:hypothetical protein